jgi:hypothetical protein
MNTQADGLIISVTLTLFMLSDDNREKYQTSLNSIYHRCIWSSMHPMKRKEENEKFNYWQVW